MGRAKEQFPSLVAGYVGCTEALEQHRRAGQRVGQDPDHGILDFLSWQPPVLIALRSLLRDQATGDVVAVASAFLDGVRWGEPLPPAIAQHTRQKARLG